MDPVPFLIHSPTPAATPHGVVIVIHGMNNHGGCMSDWAAGFNAAGYHAACLTLTGHNRVPAEKHDGRLDRWLDDLLRGWREVAAKYPGLSISLCGFSLGGLLAGLFVDLFPEAPVKKLILVAPAFRPIRPAVLAYLLYPLKFIGFSLPAMIPMQYRAHNTTSITSYLGLLAGGRAFRKVSRRSFLKTPVLVLISMRDELVSARRTQPLCAEFDPPWRFLEVQPKPEGRWRPYYHMLIDRKMVGAAEWERILGESTAFLSATE